MTLNFRRALLIIDVQNDFLPGGALAVPDGHYVILAIQEIVKNYDCVVLTQDWHPADHISFAKTHRKNNFETIEVGYGVQRLWPVHCVQNTEGAKNSENLDNIQPDFVLQKGIQKTIDSYSGFIEADRKTRTGLDQFFNEKNIQHVSCVGVALDYCVIWTALDAMKLGFQTDVILKACKGIDHEGSVAHSIQRMKSAGVNLLE